VLRNKSNECEDLASKLRQTEDQLTRKGYEIEEYNGRLRRYEQNANETNSNINKLNSRVRELEEAEMTVKKYEQKIEQLSL
jgi:prefoldin subunit 5